MDRHRAEQVTLATGTPLVDATWIEGSGLFVGASTECIGVAHASFFSDGVEPDTFDARCGLGEILIDDVTVEADRFEDLRAAVRSDRGDTHLRHGLNHAVEVRFQEIVTSLLRCQVEIATVNHVADGLECEIRVNRIRAVAE